MFSIFSKSCIKCRNKKRRSDDNFAGLALGFGDRVSPTCFPGNTESDYLCKTCAQKIEVKCKDHGVLSKLGDPKTPVCPECRQEYEQFGPPPSGYSSIEAFECASKSGPQGSWAADMSDVQKLLVQHSCTCGGQWELVVGNSPMPSGIADNGYRCGSCGTMKWFRFRLWNTGAPFPKAW